MELGLYVPIINYNSVKKEVVIAVLKAFKLLEEMSGSQKNLIDIVAFGRIYTGMVHMSVPLNSSFIYKLWPITWSACTNILKEFGYTERA